MIYVAAFKERTSLNLEKFYSKEFAFLNHPNNKQRRGHFFKAALGSWYTEFKPTTKRARKSAGKATNGVGINDDWDFVDVDDFDDPFADRAPPAGVALVAAAREALAVGAAGHCKLKYALVICY